MEMFVLGTPKGSKRVPSVFGQLPLWPRSFSFQEVGVLVVVTQFLGLEGHGRSKCVWSCLLGTSCWDPVSAVKCLREFLFPTEVLGSCNLVLSRY